MRIYVDDLRAALFGFDDVRERDRVGLRHVAAHDKDSVAIDQILREVRRTTTPKRGTQTGYSGAVSDTGLVFNGENPQAPGKELFDEVILFDVQRRPPERGEGQRVIDLAPIL